MIDLSDKKILLVRNDNIGDLICTTPAIEALRKKYPTAQIDIVVNSYNQCAIYKNPFVNKIFCYTKPKHKKSLADKVSAFFGKTKMLFEIFSAKYDAVVVFRGGYSKSAELFATASRASARVGVKNPKGSDSFTHYAEIKSGMHEVEFCFECLRPFGVEYGGEKTLISPKDELRDAFGYAKDKTLVHISSRKKENQISAKKWIEIIKALQTKEILINSSPDDKEKASEIAKESGAEMAYTKNFDELVALISNSKTLITLDGGALHIGPALGVKTIGIIGSSDFERWYPWGAKEFCIKSNTGMAEDVGVEEVKERFYA